MLTVKIPKYCENEIEYSINTVLSEFLGLDVQIESHQSSFISIFNNSSKGNITLDSSFFSKADAAWLNKNSLPQVPLKIWDSSKSGLKLNLVSPNIPIIYGQPGVFINEKNIHIGIDIFGSTFFMLSRYEELVEKKRDNHERFSGIQSLAFKEGFLDRPIINEYIEVLKYCLTNLWPDLKFKDRKKNNFITCDVDWPYNPSLYSSKHMARSFLRLLLKDFDIVKALKCVYSFFLVKFGLNYQDSYINGIRWIMDINELNSNKVAFYFITSKTSSFDTLKDKDFSSSYIRNLFKEIKNRGHEIGIHPGYETFDNPKNFKKTVDNLRGFLKREGIEQKNIGGRQHFLRWDASITPILWEANNLSYDSTLSYADKSGFRCGICYEYTMYSLTNRKPLNLKQKPLIVMECSIIADRYEGLGYSDKSIERFEYFKEICHKFNGTFTLLWHNSHLEKDIDKVFYQKLIK